MKKRIFGAVFSVGLCAVAAGFLTALIISLGNAYDSTVIAVILSIVVLVLSAGIIALVSYYTATVLTNKISKKVNNIDFDNPRISKLPKEFELLCIRIEKQNKASVKQFSNLNSQKESQELLRQQFTANVSHELKTPLTSVSGYAELIRDGMVDEANISKFAGKIYDESQRMIALVNDIIKLSKFDEKDINVKIEPVNLLELSRSVIESVQPLAEKHRVTVSLSGDAVTVNGAELIIEEIIHNLVKNAIKYNKENGKVNVSVRQCIDGVELSVSDTGIGIPKEDLSHIFERFYRVDKSRSKDMGGTGLGLSIVKHGAAFHNASLSVDSKVGKGTTIRILF